ncbi:RNA polymerase subunit sigma-70 [Tersicoccus phoenicis]|uniref:RNA polymerase subunit sigma-70 n=1 Tax=Tersicoccus phoenicis TaxID=554083 RepID=A0A1R1L9G4_9MICC|nr:sigma factor [Tersicoccus phoenicis]OMH24176.1 RNA polymerase subunit sigma-70 [Tersicoccus phoenicis]
MDATDEFEVERPRLLRLAARVLSDPVEAEDVVQQAWLRMHATDGPVASLPAWLTTVTTRLCLDRLKARVPVPVEPTEEGGAAPDPADAVALMDAVGGALGVVLDRLSPAERVAFVLHDSFAVDFTAIAGMLETTPAAARKLASRARAKVAQPAAESPTGEKPTPEKPTPESPTPGKPAPGKRAGEQPDDAPPSSSHRSAPWEVVDGFLAAAREGDLDRLVGLLAPDVRISADRAAVLAGTPELIEGRDAVAAFFNGSARSALPVFVGDGPGAAWYQRGRAAVYFDFSVFDGQVVEIIFRADAVALARVRRRRGARFA